MVLGARPHPYRPLTVELPNVVDLEHNVMAGELGLRALGRVIILARMKARFAIAEHLAKAMRGQVEPVEDVRASCVVQQIFVDVPFRLVAALDLVAGR
jgi:hypothetical protein